MAPKQQFAMVPAHQLTTGDNVRRNLGDLDHLIESITQHGILEPVVACPSADGTTIEILMGHRRVAAAIEAGLTEIPCLLRARPDHETRILMQLAENLARTDMSPVDEALSYQELIDAGFTRRAIANAVGKDEVAIGKRLRLLALPETVRLAVDIGWITPAVALEIPNWIITDPTRAGRLGGVLHGGPDALRDFIRQESQASGNNRSGGDGAKVSRVLNVHIDAYEAAIRAAKVSDSTVRDWVSEVILAAAEAAA